MESPNYVDAVVGVIMSALFIGVLVFAYYTEYEVSCFKEDFQPTPFEVYKISGIDNKACEISIDSLYYLPTYETSV
ncbi:hypothetical protein SNE40_021505 [Patella caerulea]|uniref:Uncharacterized protein n=1 Tax=Patella caerulea TaxID=87958 RepID=A0AAN8GIV3_PATCE